MNRRLVLRSILLVLAACAASSCARATDCVPEFRDGWINLPPVPDAHMLAGYGRIENKCPTTMTLVSAASPRFMDVSLHETTLVDGVSRMRAVKELPIAGKKVATLAPGGLHLMLMHPSAPLKEGDKVPVTFKLKDGYEVVGELVVKKATP